MLLTIHVSVIATVKNESSSIDRLLESLTCQTRLPNEVIIVDGGSTDDTVEQLREWQVSGRLPLQVLLEPGCNIARGRNTAIRAALGPIIASTDAGVRLEPDWLERLCEPFSTDRTEPPEPIVACGFFAPDTDTVFETAMGATVLPAAEDIKAKTFLPSSRSVAYSKSAWEAVGGYPEWLDYCEDVILDLMLRARGYRFVFVPEAVAHFKPRGSLGAFFKQYCRYARGDGKARLWDWRHALRYFTYLALVPALSCLAATRGPTWLLPLLLGVAILLWTPYKRLRPAMHRFGAWDRLRAAAWVPVIRLTGDVAKMLGYPAGALWRLRHGHRIPKWRD